MSEKQELIDEAEHHLQRTLVLSGVGYEQKLMRRLIKALKAAPSPDLEKLIEEAADEYVIGMLGPSTTDDLKRAFFAGTHFATPAKVVDEAELTTLILGKTATQAAKDIKRYLEDR